MIRTYGLYWHKDRVDWGKQNNAGRLLGAASNKERAAPVNFRAQRGVYVLYSGFDIVYIGQTGAGNQRLFERLRSHRSDHLAERWDRFSWFGTQWVKTDHTLSGDTQTPNPRTIAHHLNILEAVLIATAEPKLNLQRGRWADATQYFQVAANSNSL